MERNDLLLNVSCSRRENEISSKLPLKMPDGSQIINENLKKKIAKTHTLSGKVFIPVHKLPVLDEFGLCASNDDKPAPKVATLRAAKSQEAKKVAEDEPAQKGKKRKKRKKRDEEPKIIPSEVKDVAGGLPPSFPKYTLKKFTEGYKPREDLQPEKKRRKYVPGEAARNREKSISYTKMELDEIKDLHPYMISNLKQNFAVKHLTKVQSLVIPELVNSMITKELIVNSGVGSGKTLSYAVPIVNNLAKMEPRIDRTTGIYALVLLPTREQAAKVNETFANLCKSFLWIVPGLLTGGERKKSEKARLRKGMNILITTPGRLIDHMEHSKNLDFSRMIYCVIADAHRLLDAERSEVAKKIFLVLRKNLPKTCTRCLVTATFTKKLEKLSEIIISDPKYVDAHNMSEV